MPFEGRSKEVVDEIAGKLQNVLAQASSAGYQAAYDSAPERSGDLRESGWWGVWRGGNLVAGMASAPDGSPVSLPAGAPQSDDALTAGFGFNDPVAQVLYLGSRGMPGDPFLDRGDAEMQRVFDTAGSNLGGDQQE